MGVRDLEARVTDLEKRMRNFCSTCELKGLAEQMRDWKKDAFDDFINTTLEKSSILKADIDKLGDVNLADQQQAVNLAVQVEAQRGDMNADLRLIVDLEARIFQLQKEFKEWKDYNKKLYTYVKKHDRKT